MQERVNRIVEDYGMISKDVCLIVIQKALDELPLMPITTDYEKDQFKKAFLIVMLGLLLCPTTNGQSMATVLLPAVSIGAAASDFDWCSCAHSWLMTCVRDFRKKLESKRYAPGGGGYVLFLKIFYLDHIALPRLSWGHMPRLEVWTEKKLGVAIQADLLPSLDYGKLKTVDVAYGERHPLVGRDSFQPLEVRIANEPMLKPMFENMEMMLKAGNNRPTLRNAPKERSPVPSGAVTSSGSDSIKERELESPNVNRTSLDETFRKLDDVDIVGNTQFTVGEVIKEVASKVCSEFCHVHHPKTGNIAPELSPKDVNKKGTYCESVGGKGDKSAEACQMAASGDKGEAVNGLEGEGNKDNGERGKGGLGKGLHEHEASQLHSHESEASFISEEAEDGDKNRNQSVGKRSLKPSSKVISGDYVVNRRFRVLKPADTNL